MPGSAPANRLLPPTRVVPLPTLVIGLSMIVLLNEAVVGPIPLSKYTPSLPVLFESVALVRLKLTTDESPVLTIAPPLPAALFPEDRRQ